MHWGRPEPWRALPRWQRARLIRLAASSHHPPSLDAALAHCGTVIEAEVLASAIIAGDLKTCRRLYETEGCTRNCSLVGTAAGLSGSLPVCEWLAEAMPNHHAELQRDVMPAAILAGHERVVEWALERFGNDRGQGGAWRLQLLASRGLGLCLEHDAPVAAGAIGSTATVEFCLDLLPSCRASLRYLLLEDPAADLAQGNDAAAGWCNEFRDAAVRGADLPLLQHLHEQLGASIDLVAVAKAGSEEALSWAVAALGAAGQAPESLSKGDFKSVLCYGNWAAADWMVRHGLAPPRQELLRHVLLEPPFLDLSRLTSIPTLQWVVGMRGGQDRVQVQWTAELHAALMYKRKTYAQGFGNETPCRLRWLAKLVETVGAELAGAAGGPPGAGATAASIAQS
ncbi:hypothetical protein HXX76_012325 [Chlamydomonas incerta]|uniref:Uncharacterized protein n=1 Tax=Chlamydomonas incerta TaxID=51695 RepID=A0A835VWG9_CHLIN|nr:hypothetical protein HXX76_012325 [Chlamydomonas incerta]|eukprot:KAG2427676.1 hypothetical protein HXX76_012325 [Chlamydomonas incerta]